MITITSSRRSTPVSREAPTRLPSWICKRRTKLVQFAPKLMNLWSLENPLIHRDSRDNRVTRGLKCRICAPRARWTGAQTQKNPPPPDGKRSRIFSKSLILLEQSRNAAGCRVGNGKGLHPQPLFDLTGQKFGTFNTKVGIHKIPNPLAD